jgi:hypothetical protein
LFQQNKLFQRNKSVIVKLNLRSGILFLRTAFVITAVGCFLANLYYKTGFTMIRRTNKCQMKKNAEQKTPKTEMSNEKTPKVNISKRKST